MQQTLLLLAIIVAGAVIGLFLVGVVVTRFYKKVPQSQALSALVWRMRKESEGI